MTTVSLTTPANIGTRDLVRAWLSSALPLELEATVVEVDCAPLLAPTPSFVDELLRILVVERDAVLVRFVHASDRARELVQQVAQNRQIPDRIEIVPSEPERGIRDWIRHRVG